MVLEIATTTGAITGAFLAGFGVMHSMVFNQIGAVVALANGLLPLRKVAHAQAEKDRAAELLLAAHPGGEDDEEIYSR